MNQDERVERALRVLTEAQPPEGMEERVLRRLEGRRAEADVRGSWLVPVGVIVAVAVFALVVGVRHHSASPVVVVADRGNAVSLSSIPQGTSSKTPSFKATKDGAANPSRAALHVRPVRVEQVDEVSLPAPVAPLTEQEKMLVRLARAREAAMLAPPAVVPREVAADAGGPLTGQEKLLVAVSRVQQPEVLNALDPARRAAEDARDKREFARYLASVDHGGSL